MNLAKSRAQTAQPPILAISSDLAMLDLLYKR